MENKNSRVASGLTALMVAVFFMGVQTAHAAPSIADGLYLGGSGGYGTLIVSATTTDNSQVGEDRSFSGFNDGGLGLDGGAYGAFMGYGFRMDRLYVGAEVDGIWSEIKLDPGTFTIKRHRTGLNGKGPNDNISQGSAELWFSSGVTGRIGWYLSPTSLFTLHGGAVGSAFDVSWAAQGEEYWDIGTRYGLGIDTSVTDNIALRLNWSFVDYYDAEVFGVGSTEERSEGISVEIQPTLSIAQVGLLYTF